MNDSFFELSEEKQLRIINAGLEIFAASDYRHASTDEIGRKAGISKGLLFYYFHNKKSYYLFLYDYAFKQILEYVVRADYTQYTDFFERCEYAAKKKQELLEGYPYLFDFMLKAFCSEKEDVSEELNRRFTDTLSQLYGNYFNHIDIDKFKPGVSAEEILQMLTWMSDGYVHELRRNAEHMSMELFIAKYKRWSELFKQMAYKEEFLHD